MLDINDVTQLMESMGISTPHRLVLKATFAGWKKNPDAAFEALASAKVTLALQSALMYVLLLRDIVSRLLLRRRRRRRLLQHKERYRRSCASEGII